MKDWKFNSKSFLVVTTTFGFFALIVLLFFHDIPEGTKSILQVLLGGVAGQWASMVQFDFGSSSGSASKDKDRSDLIGKLTGTGDGATTTKATIETKTELKSEEKPKEIP